MSLALCSLGVVTGPLFGNAWLALLAILAGIGCFMAVVAAVGRWLAATHPSTVTAHSTLKLPSEELAMAVAARNEIPPPEVLAIIAAAVRVTLGAGARITQVVPAKVAAPSVEMLMQQWSMEGRRQIYSSHQIR